MDGHDSITWRCHSKLEKFHDKHATEPYEVIEEDGNLLMYGGASAIWDTLTGGGTVTVFDNTNAFIGVGDDNTPAAADQTDLEAASNKHREAMDATYPIHTDGVVEASSSIVFKSTFEAADANFSWNEWGIFNDATADRMLNRKVVNYGLKVNPAVWSLTLTLQII